MLFINKRYSSDLALLGLFESGGGSERSTAAKCARACIKRGGLAGPFYLKAVGSTYRTLKPTPGCALGEGHVRINAY